MIRRARIVVELTGEAPTLHTWYVSLASGARMIGEDVATHYDLLNDDGTPMHEPTDSDEE